VVFKRISSSAVFVRKFVQSGNLHLLCRLSEISDWRVLLLEAGGEEPPQAGVPAYIPFSWKTSVDWQFQTEPHKGYCGGKSCTWNAGKVLGGGSILNGMIYNRGNARSYDAWKELGKEPVSRLIALCCVQFCSYRTQNVLNFWLCWKKGLRPILIKLSTSRIWSWVSTSTPPYVFKG
jgi:choline dehydrogenase-like flavoprotein